MKLHLPKQLFTALLAAITLAAPAALTLGSTAWGDPAEAVITTADYITIEDTVYGDTVYGTDDNTDDAEIYVITETGTITPTGQQAYFVLAEGRAEINSNVFAANQTNANQTIVLAAGSYTTTDGTTTEFSGGQLFVNAGSVTISNNIILGSSSYTEGDINQWGGAMRLHDGEVTLSGTITLVQDARVVINRNAYFTNTVSGAGKTLTLNEYGPSTGKTVTFSGSACELGGLAGSAGIIFNGGSGNTYTIGNISSTGNVTVQSGSVKLTGEMSGSKVLSIAEGAEFIVQENATLNIARTITGAGTLTNNGTLNVSDYTQLNNFTATYTDSASGFRTGFTATLLTGTTLAGPGSVTYSGQAAGDKISMNNGVLTATFANNNGVYYINDARKYDTAPGISDATSLEIGSAGSLSVNLSEGNTTVAAPKPIANSGALALSVGAKAVDLDSLFSGTNAITQTATGTTTITGTGAVSMDAALSVSGTIIIDGAGSFINSGHTLTLDKLVLQGVANATLTGSSSSIGKVTGIIEVLGGSKLTLGDGTVTGGWDHLGWNNGNTDKVLLRGESAEKKATLHVNSRQTFSSALVMEGYSTVLGNTETGDNTKGQLQMHTNGSVTASGTDNTISCEFYINNPTTVQVTGSNGSLTIDGKITGNSALTKTGAGTLYLKSGIGGQKIKNLTITGGTVRTDQEDALDYNSTTTMSVQNATLDLDARQSVDSSNSFSLNNGTISGDGGTNSMMNNEKVGLEVHNASTLLISSAGTSSITTNIGFRNEAGKVEYTVTGGTLTNSGIIASHNNGITGAVVKKGAGELILSGANTYAKGTTVEAGTLTVNHASALGTGSVLLKTGSILTLGATVTNAIAVDVQEGETKNWAEIKLSNNARLDHNNTSVTTNNDTKVAYTVNSGSTLTIKQAGNTSNIERLNIAGGTVKLSEWNASLGSSEAYVNMTLSNDGINDGTFSFTNGNPANNGGKMYLNVEVDGSGKLAGSGNGFDSNIIGTITSNGDNGHDTLKLGKEGDTDNWWTISATIEDHANETDKLAVQKVDDVKVVLSGANTYSGGTTIEAGTVTTQNASALGTGGVNMTGGELVVSNVANTDTDLTVGGAIVMNAAATAKLATDGTTLNLGTTGSVKKTNGSQYVTISSDGDTAASMTAKADNAQLVQLQEDASFTIQDMTLTNTTITAATATTRVNLSNVSGDAKLVKGTFGLQMQSGAPQVGMGGASLSYGVAGTPSLTLGATEASLVITVDPTADVSGAYGTYTLTFNLDVNLYSVPVSGEDWKALVGFEGWLGTMLENQGATYQVADGAAQVAEGNSAPTVSYGYAPGNVGTLTITITGLNVPEPASATLGLAALMMLCARRRRKA